MAFSTAPISPTTPARFGLTADQLHLLQSRCPDLTLPAEFYSDWAAEVPEIERAERMLVAELGLIDQGLLRAAPTDTPTAAPIDTHSDTFAARVHPAVLGFLGLFTEPALLLAVHSWGGGRTIVQTIAVRAGFAASLVRGQRLDDHGGHPANEDAVELSAFPVSALIGETLRSLVRLEPKKRPRPPHGRSAAAVVLPLTLAQGMIGAIRTGNPEIIHAAALTVGLPQAEQVLEGPAFGIDAGYSVAATSLTGDSLAVHWFRSAAGWFQMSADTPLVGRIESTVDFVDSSRVRIETTGPAAITGQVTTAIGSLLGVLRG
ncbi:hypothetical protein C3B61_00380 [Cryobacterium zongtaii]|uniref:ESX secretion-associated protein EspG n=1 Tax=Cryobacterium zongtaii TaxID=1259217 RepID=A0A2S3ZMQ6_9MICO|nr:hypothetical protein [Cryobacterium zongtaii]POH70113.1 hypothetical protein C3B61_00380 [Cryobacterium zongtaii]